MGSRKTTIVMAAVLLAALANGANATATENMDFHLWLKCKAIELYVNITGANFTLPQCRILLSEINETFIVGRAGAAPKPMIGVGELRLLNVTDARRVFLVLRQIRLAAVRELGKHLNKTIDNVYRLINASKDAAGLLNSTEKGLGVLMRVRNMLRLVNASGSAVGAVEAEIKWLNLTKWLVDEEARINKRIDVSGVGIENILNDVGRGGER